MALDIIVDIHTDKDAAVDTTVALDKDTAVSVDMDANVLRRKPTDRDRDNTDLEETLIQEWSQPGLTMGALPEGGHRRCHRHSLPQMLHSQTLKVFWRIPNI